MTESPSCPAAHDLAARLPELADTVADGLIAGCARNGAVDDRDVRAAAMTALDVVGALIAGRDCVRPLGVIERSAARWAQRGVELPDITHALHKGARIVIDELSAGLAPQATVAVLPHLFSALKMLCAAVSRSYLRQLTPGAADMSHAEYGVAAALLGGRVVTGAARAAGVALADGYWVFALAFVRPLRGRPEIRTWSESVCHELRQRRRQRGGGDPLVVAGAELATVLVPTSQLAESDTGDVVELVSKTLGQQIHAVVLDADVSALRHTANLGHELVRLARDNGYPGGLYRLTDLAVERVLARPGAERDQLVEMIAPLAARPHLLDTLRAHLLTGLNRPRTAEILSIHLNTLDYRLGRIKTVTGLDVRVPDQSFRIRAAMIAYNAVNPGGAPEFAR
ncbi:PucR family transcriptional regulator [Nocardia nova]|uniref:PucR family transcriptional regulator n=1 Tax=Nocardia nova TaxID=37330 RepID=UPI0033C4D6CB